MSDERFCMKPDRDVPALTCGYPLPCPWHTVLIEDAIVDLAPESPADAETFGKLIDVARSLQGKEDEAPK